MIFPVHESLCAHVQWYLCILSVGSYCRCSAYKNPISFVWNQLRLPGNRISLPCRHYSSARLSWLLALLPQMCLSFRPPYNNPQSVPEGNIFYQCQQSPSDMTNASTKKQKTKTKKLNADTRSAKHAHACRGRVEAEKGQIEEEGKMSFIGQDLTFVIFRGICGFRRGDSAKIENLWGYICIWILSPSKTASYKNMCLYYWS